MNDNLIVSLETPIAPSQNGLSTLADPVSTSVWAASNVATWAVTTGDTLAAIHHSLC